MKIAILNPYFDSLGGGEKVVTVMAEHLSKRDEVVILTSKQVDVGKVEQYFNVDLSRVTFQLIPKDPLFIRLIAHPHLRLPGRWRSMLYDSSSRRALKKVNADVFINNLYQSSLPSSAPKSIYMCMFPQKLEIIHDTLSKPKQIYSDFTDKLEKRTLGSRADAINSYTLVTANSRYTASWIKKYWNRDADVLYPVCDDMGPPPPAKKNSILNVGRFFADNGSSHHKKQHELVKAFIELGRDDWELHLAGSAASDVDSQKYIKKLQKMAGGHSNIFIHTNASFPELCKLYEEAAIYWHATGLGYDQEEFPENQEHFGISTVEAMSAGAVPVVINTAGQQEVVEHQKTGLLWDNTTQLLDMTNQLINDQKLMSKMAEAAVKKSKDFDRQAFIKRLDQVMTRLEEA